MRPLPPAGQRPADGVREEPEHQPERRRDRASETEHRVRRDAREQGSRLGARGRRAARGPSRGAAPAARSGPSAIGWPRRSGRPAAGARRPAAPTRRASGPNSRAHAAASGPSASAARRPVRESRSSTTARSGVERDVRPGLGMDPLDAVPGEVHGPEERRRDPQRMGGRADVVDEPGQRQLGRPRAAADGVGRLVDAHGAPRTGELDRRGEAVGAAAHDDRVERPRRDGSTGHGRTVRTGSAGRRRRRAQRAGRRHRADGHVHGRAVPDVAGVSPLPAPVDAQLARARRSASRRPATGRGSRASAPRTGRWPGSRRTCSASSISGSLVRSRAWTWRDRLVAVAVRGERDPGRRARGPRAS